MGYVLAVRANHAFVLGSGRTLTAAGAVRLIPRGAWQRMRTGHGTKGSRHYDWAMLEVTGDDAPGGQHGQRDAGRSALLVRRHRYTGTCSYYRCWAPGSVPLARLIAVAQARWKIEENHQLANASVAHCAFFSSGVLDGSSLAGFYLDPQAAAASAADMHGGEFATLDLMQNGLPGDAEGGGGLPQR